MKRTYPTVAKDGQQAYAEKEQAVSQAETDAKQAAVFKKQAALREAVAVEEKQKLVGGDSGLNLDSRRTGRTAERENVQTVDKSLEEQQYKQTSARARNAVGKTHGRDIRIPEEPMNRKVKRKSKGTTRKSTDQTTFRPVVLATSRVSSQDTERHTDKFKSAMQQKDL